MSSGKGGVPRQFSPHGGDGWDPIEFGDHGHKGAFGEQFVATLATAANLEPVKSAHRDRFGVDWTLSRPGRVEGVRYPSIDIQVKCWAAPERSGDEWRYPLRLHNYNKLAGRDYATPRFLFLVIVPHSAKHWAEVTHDYCQLRHAAYWQCFHDDEPMEDKPADSTTTVSVPHANLLNVDSLHSLFGSAYRERLVPQQ